MSRASIANWYAAQSPRDQRVLVIGGVAAAILLLAGLFLPLRSKLIAARAELQQQQADLQWMRQVGPALAAAGPAPAALATADSLVVLIDTSARESGLAQALTGTQPASDGAMRVQLEGADFNAVTAWVSRLSTQHGVRVEAATITASNAPGVVNATVLLRAR
jgi:general secretion pathway protein M